MHCRKEDEDGEEAVVLLRCSSSAAFAVGVNREGGRRRATAATATPA
nr:hypothetical protein Itr_chr06CG16610 [Ipomoea trifida]GLL29896.1 hypothetical protein Itr_chr06CG16620 [Ipomoea trifida]